MCSNRNYHSVPTRRQSVTRTDTIKGVGWFRVNTQYSLFSTLPNLNPRSFKMSDINATRLPYYGGNPFIPYIGDGVNHTLTGTRSER